MTATWHGRFAQPGGHPASRRPARHGSRAHPLRRPAGRCQGDPVLPAGHRDPRPRKDRRQQRQGQPSRSPPDCPLGLHDIRLRTATGVSELRVFSVGAYPEISEAEPNNDFEAPQPINLGTVVNGVAENEDIDYFVVEAKKGQRITAEVEGIRLGITHFDPYLAILDSKRFELATSDDRALVRQDGECSLIVPEDGRYIIAVRESAYAGNGNCLYRLHVGKLPPPHRHSARRRPSRPVRRGHLDRRSRWALSPPPSSLPNETRPQQLRPRRPRRPGRGPLPQRLPGRPSAQRDRSRAQQRPRHGHGLRPPPAALNGIIDKDGDTDFFTFTATKGQVLDIQVYARRLRSPLDPVLHVARKGGAYIAGADDSAGPDATLRFTAPEDGEYVIYLHDHLTKGSPDAFYRIEVTPVEARTVMSVTTEQMPLGTGAIAAAVPRGNRQAVLVSASRVDWGGDLKVELPGLARRRHGRVRRHGRQPARRARPLQRGGRRPPDRPLGAGPRAARSTPTSRRPPPNSRPPACSS